MLPPSYKLVDVANKAPICQQVPIVGPRGPKVPIYARNLCPGSTLCLHHAEFIRMLGYIGRQVLYTRDLVILVYVLLH